MGYEKNLNGEYLRVYNEVIDELQVEEISVDLTKEVENDILDMFLCAQYDGASVASVIGESPRSFILEIVKDFNKANSGLFRIGQTISHAILGIGALSFLDIRDGKLNFTSDILIVATIVILSDFLGRSFSRKYNVGKSRSQSKNYIEWGFFLCATIIAVAITVSLDLPVLFVIDKPYLFAGGFMLVSFIINMGLEAKFK